MKALAYTSPCCWVFWAVFLFAYLPEYVLIARSKPPKGERSDRGSLQAIVLAGWIGSLGAFYFAAISRYQFVRGRLAWFAGGLLMLLVGRFLRNHCWRMLGKHFTGDVRAVTDQPVIQEGLYRWVRHPSYSGGILMYLGTGMALTSWLSVVMMTVPTLLAYVYRVNVEERALVEHTGSRYTEYKAHTKRFIPFVY